MLALQITKSAWAELQILFPEVCQLHRHVTNSGDGGNRFMGKADDHKCMYTTKVFHLSDQYD